MKLLREAREIADKVHRLDALVADRETLTEEIDRMVGQINEAVGERLPPARRPRQKLLAAPTPSPDEATATPSAAAGSPSAGVAPATRPGRARGGVGAAIRDYVLAHAGVHTAPSVFAKLAEQGVKVSSVAVVSIELSTLAASGKITRVRRGYYASTGRRGAPAPAAPREEAPGEEPEDAVPNADPDADPDPDAAAADEVETPPLRQPARPKGRPPTPEAAKTPPLKRCKVEVDGRPCGAPTPVYQYGQHLRQAHGMADVNPRAAMLWYDAPANAR